MEEFSLFDNMQQQSQGPVKSTPSNTNSTSPTTNSNSNTAVRTALKGTPNSRKLPANQDVTLSNQMKASNASAPTNGGTGTSPSQPGRSVTEDVNKRAALQPIRPSSASSKGKGGASPRPVSKETKAGPARTGAGGNGGEEEGETEVGKQRRLKWVDSEIEILWTGIYTFGNEWREIQKTLPGRTYHQVKDKGRRLLHKCGWSTGRTKSYSEGAKAEAKAIAGDELAKLTGKKVKKRKSTKPAKGGQTPKVKRTSPSGGGSRSGAFRGHARSGLSSKTNDVNGFERVFGVPLQEGYLVGMSERTEFLRLAIANGAKSFPQQTTMVQVEGDFGAGKSALVKDFVHKFQDFYTGGVYWLDACLYSRLKTELQLMATKYLGVKLQSGDEQSMDRLLQKVWKALEAYSKWLVVFDNVQDENVLRLARAPETLKGKGTVLILCEEADQSMLNVSKVHRVPPLSSAECVNMLEDLVGIPENKLTREQRLCFRSFVNDPSVQGMPGSVRITGQYLAKYGIRGAESFLDALKTMRYDLDLSNHSKYFAGRVMVNTNDNLYETFGRSNLIEALWNQIRSKLGHASKRLLELCSFLCPNGIAASILAKAIGPNGQALLAAPTVSSAHGSEQVVSRAIEELSDLCLVLSDHGRTKVTVSTGIQNAVIQTLVRERRFFEVAFNVFECFDAIHSAVAPNSFLPQLSSVLRRIEHLLNFDVTDSNRRAEVTGKVKKYGAMFKAGLEQDGVDVDRILQLLSTTKAVTQTSAVELQGLKAVKQIESFLQADDGSDKPSAITKTFATQV